MTKKTDQMRRLSRQLSRGLILRLFAAYLALDICLVLLFAGGGILYAERSMANQVAQVREATPDSLLYSSYQQRRPLSLDGMEINYRPSPPYPLPLAGFMRSWLPANTREGERSFQADGIDGNMGFHASLRSVRYTISLPWISSARDDRGEPISEATNPSSPQTSYINFSLGLGEFLFYALIALYIIFGLQLLSLLDSGIKTGRAVRAALEPLRELGRATRQFTEASKSAGRQPSPQSMKDLANALDAINVAHLDQRIPNHIIAEELKPLAEAINEMLNRIDEAYNTQIRFVSDASHELRTPIAVIQGYANLLSRWGSEDPATLKESIEAIRSEADAMKQMVNQLLFLARGDSASMKLKWERLNLSAIAAEVVKEESMIDQAHDFHAELDPDIFVEGDAGLIKQLLRILSDNSVKYTDGGGRITVTLEKGDQARLTVRDEGAGIPAEILPHIFDRFVRADESRTRNTGGAGLGLSIAKWIVDRHGGYFEVVSREGLGTKMTVVLPLSENADVMDGVAATDVTADVMNVTAP